MSLNLILGTNGNDYVLGSDGADLFRGKGGQDDLFGGKGRDTYFGGAGDDTAMDFLGESFMSGGSGNDFLASCDLDDTLLGGAGDDLLSGGTGANVLNGGAGKDTISASGDASGDTSAIFAGSGNDRVSFGGLAGGTAFGGSGIDTIEIAWAHTLDDISLHLHGPLRGITNSLGQTALTGIEQVEAFTGSGNDTVIGGDHRDVISLGSGNNTAKGHGGNDVLLFRAGGVNRIDGGDGTDLVNIENHGEGWQFFVSGLSAIDNFGDRLTNIERWQITGSQKADMVSLGNRDDFFDGRDGNDTGFGQGGADYLYGGLGDDTLYGGAGADVLTGGDGADALTGGAGADRFIFTKPGDLGDLIMDFTSGDDQIDIAAKLVGKALPTGAVDGGSFHLDLANGAAAQFILRTGTGGFATELIFDSNGSDDGGERVIAGFAGPVTLTAEDLLIL